MIIKKLFVVVFFIFLVPMVLSFNPNDCNFDDDPHLKKACMVFLSDLPEDSEVFCDYECSWNSPNLDGEILFSYSNDKEYLEDEIRQKENAVSGEYKEEYFEDILWSEFHEQAYYVDGVAIVSEENSFSFYIESPNKQYNDKYLGVFIFTGGYDKDEAKDKSLDVLKALDGGEVIEIQENLTSAKKEPDNKREVKALNPFDGKNLNNTKEKKIEDLDSNDLSNIQKIMFNDIAKKVVNDAEKIGKLRNNLTPIKTNELDDIKLYAGQDLVDKKYKSANTDIKKKLKAAHNYASLFSKVYEKSKFAKAVEIYYDVKDTKSDLDKISSIKGSSGNLAKGLYFIANLGKRAGEKVPILGKALKTYGEVTEKIVTAIPQTQEKVLTGTWQGEVRHGKHGSYAPNAFANKYSDDDSLKYKNENGEEISEKNIDYWKKLSSGSESYWVPYDQYGTRTGDVAIKEISGGWKIWRNDNVKLVKFSNPSIEYNGGEEFDL